MRMTGGIFWRMFAVVLVSASAEVNAPAEPSAGGGNDVLAEIVVTAQRRFEKLTDAPVSITAAIGDQQHNLGVNSPADVVKLVPGSKPTNDFESSRARRMADLRRRMRRDLPADGSPRVSTPA